VIFEYSDNRRERKYNLYLYLILDKVKKVLEGVNVWEMGKHVKVISFCKIMYQ